MIFSSQPVLFEVVEARGTYPEGSCLMAGPDRSYILSPLSNVVDEAYTVGCAVVSIRDVGKACTWAADRALPNRGACSSVVQQLCVRSGAPQPALIGELLAEWRLTSREQSTLPKWPLHNDVWSNWLAAQTAKKQCPPQGYRFHY